MKKSMIIMSTLILTVCFGFLMLAGCDDDYHHGKKFRSRRHSYKARRVHDDRCCRLERRRGSYHRR